MIKVTLKTELLPHQAAAVEKLRRLKVGALFMEMGTGKTRTALELIKLRMDAGKVNRVLWLCPCSVKGNLLADIRKHSDLAEMPGMLTICGIETLSSSIRTYSELLAMVEGEPTYLVVDESSLIKNPAALRSRHITAIAEFCQYKLILNGTPISRNEADLFSQFYILDWRILGYRSFYSFAANHLEYDKDRPGRIVRALNVDYLARKIAPYAYECRKEDTIILPEKSYETEYFHLTEAQERNYDEVIDHLMMAAGDMRDVQIYQLFGALQSITSGFHVEITWERDGPHTHRTPMFPAGEQNPRTKLLMEALDGIPETEQILIFCVYTEEIDSIARILNQRWPDSVVTFYGEIPQRQRQQRIEHFRSGKRFMVANKTCGAFGLNLQFCHRIIFYSNDWNWGTRAQAEDRVHRLGQIEKVEIVDLVAANTIDEQIVRCLSRKENLAESFKRELKDRNGFLKGRTDGKDLSEAKRVRGSAKAV